MTTAVFAGVVLLAAIAARRATRPAPAAEVPAPGGLADQRSPAALVGAAGNR
jgi:hypothetical protein